MQRLDEVRKRWATGLSLDWLAAYHTALGRTNVLIAYIDESGHSAEARVVSLAAFVASATQWRRFSADWTGALKDHGAPFLHMREFAHRQGNFKGWSEDQRRSLLGALLDVIVANQLIAVGAAIDVNAFRALPTDIRAGLQDPFLCCAQEVLYGLALVGQPGPATDAVFSRQDEFAGKAEKLWEHLRNRSGFSPGLGSLRFEDMRSTPALQAADLLAYELRHYYNRRLTYSGTPARYPFRRIIEDQLSRGRRLIKLLPAWYVELQASAEFEVAMKNLMSDPSTALSVMAELWPEVATNQGTT